MPPKIPANVFGYALAFLPPTIFALYYQSYGPEEKDIEAKLREQYSNEIRLSESKREDMSRVFQAAIKRRNKEEFYNSELDQMLKAGTEARTRLYAVDKELYGTQYGQQVKQQMEEQIQKEKDEKKKKRKKKKKKEKLVSEQEETEGNETLQAVDAIAREEEQQQKHVGKSTHEDNINKFTKKLKRKKLKEKADDKTIAAKVEETLPKTNEMRNSPTQRNAMDAQTVVTVTTLATLAAVAGYLAGSRRSQ